MYRSRAVVFLCPDATTTNANQLCCLRLKFEVRTTPTTEVPVRDFTDWTDVFHDQLNHHSHPGRELAEANGEKLVIDSL